MPIRLPSRTCLSQRKTFRFLRTRPSRRRRRLLLNDAPNDAKSRQNGMRTTRQLANVSHRNAHARTVTATFGMLSKAGTSTSQTRLRLHAPSPMWLLREAAAAPLAETTTDHHAIVMQDANNGHAIVSERVRVARLLLVNRHRVPNSLLASEPIVMKWPSARLPFRVKKLLRPMVFLLKEDRIEVRDAEANRVVTPLVQSEVMHRDRDSDLLKRLPLKKPGHRDRCLPNQYRLVLMMDSHRVWMTNQSHVAALHLP